jgi:hypothetical protein
MEENTTSLDGYTGWLHTGHVELGINGRGYTWVMTNEWYKDGLLLRRGRTQGAEYAEKADAVNAVALAVSDAVAAKPGRVG